MTEVVGGHLRNNCFALGARNPALCRSEFVNEFCHGDDFVTGENILTKNQKCCTDLSR